MAAWSSATANRCSIDGVGGTGVPSIGGPRVLAHAQRVRGGFDVAVPDDGNLERGDHGGDLIPPCEPGVHLRASSRVQRQGTRARVLTAEPDRDRIAHLLVPAASDLAGHGQVRRRHHRADDLLHQVEIAQAARAAVPPHDLLDRAAEVDVDELRLEHVGHEPRRLAHRDRVGAEDLDADRALVGPEGELVERRLVLAANPLGGEELGDDHVRAVPAAEPPEGRLRHAGHRCEIQRHRGVESEREAHSESYRASEVQATSRFDKQRRRGLASAAPS
jgi:hypothetical protein